MFVGRVDNVLIDFICDDVGVILLCEVCDKQKLLLGKDFAAGVRGVAENERLGVLLECLLQLRWVKVKFRRMTESVKVLVRLDSGCMVRLSLDIRFLIIEDVLGVQGVFDLVHGRQNLRLDLAEEIAALT